MKVVIFKDVEFDTNGIYCTVSLNKGVVRVKLYDKHITDVYPYEVVLTSDNSNMYNEKLFFNRHMLDLKFSFRRNYYLNRDSRIYDFDSVFQRYACFHQMRVYDKDILMKRDYIDIMK